MTCNCDHCDTVPGHNRKPMADSEAVELLKRIAALESECAKLLAAYRPALERLTAELLEHELVAGDVVDACLADNGGQQALPLAA